jgi:TRAP-type C4-dicarboxylate transport system substrate-binding protein
MKLRTWQTGLGVLCALFMVLLIQGRVESAQKPVKMKLAGAFPPPEVSMMSEAVKSWEDEVTKRTNGAITFENFWGSSLGSPPEHIELVKNGAVQLANMHQWYTPTKMPFGDFEYVFPFGPTDYELVVKASRQIRSEFPQFTKELDQQNVVLIADLPFGVYNFMSKEPLRTVKDFEGKKVSLIGRFFGKWLPPGATAVVRPGQERYDLLRSGVVDADLLPFDLLYAFKIHEVTKYYDQVDLITCNGAVIVMNKDAFNSLSPENQKIALEAGKETEMRAAREIIPKWHEKCYKAWKAAGLDFIVFPKEEKVKWANSVPDTAEEWALEMDAKGLPGTAVVKRWQEITAKLGYEWPRKWGPK